MQRLRSALFIDFDNIFGGLLTLDRTAAIRFATDPLWFLQRLARYRLTDTHRALLVRRAYLNPAGSLFDEALGNDNHRLYLQKFRPNLTKAGFEVIDCPALTSGQKNAADIRIVIDVLTALDQPTTYDEILIASSDADFTPLLQRIRALDRRTTIITAGQTAPAYKAVADNYIDEEALIDLLTDDGDPGAGADSSAVAPAPSPFPGTSPTVVPTAVDTATAREMAADLLVSEMATAPGPVHLAEVGNRIHNHVGSDLVRTTRWFGHANLSAFAAAVTDGRLRVAGHMMWDPDRHEPPAGAVDVPPLIDQVCTITDLPRLPTDRWAALLETLSAYAATHTFNLTEATAWSRDQLAAAATPVPRQAIGFVVRGTMYGGVRLDRDPPPTADELRDGLLQTTVERARSAGLDVDDDARQQLARWLAGDHPDA